MPPSPSIAIVGAGAIGAFYGGRLAQHGHDVHFLLRSDYDAVRNNGWSIRSYQGDFHLSPDQFQAYNDAGAMPRMDLIVVTLKATSSDLYEPLIRPLLKEDSVVVTLQNGLGNEQQLAERFGAHRVIGGIAYVCCTRIAPGVIDHSFNGRVQLAELNGEKTQRMHRIAQAFNSSEIPAEIIDSLDWGKWRKLVWNVPFGGLCALLDLRTDEILAEPAGVQLVSAMMREVIDTAQALGLKMPDDLVEKMIPYTHQMGRYRSSMQVDRQQGRPMEIEAIIGEPLRKAKGLGVHTPRLAALYEMLLVLDRRSRPALQQPVNSR